MRAWGTIMNFAVVADFLGVSASKDVGRHKRVVVQLGH